MKPNFWSSFSTNLFIVDPFSLDYVIHFYKSKKGLSSAVSTTKILATETLDCLDRSCDSLPESIPLVNECPTMLSVNNVTKST